MGWPLVDTSREFWQAEALGLDMGKLEGERVEVRAETGTFHFFELERVGRAERAREIAARAREAIEKTPGV